jgi:hypothetical protein
MGLATTCSATVDQLIGLADGQFSVKDNKDYATYISQGFTSGVNSTCSVTLYNTPPNKGAGQSDLLMLEKAFVKQFNAFYGVQDSGPQVLAIDTIAVDQFIGASTTPVFSYVKLTINGNYLCRSCSSTSSSSGKAKKKTKNISQKIFNKVTTRQFYSGVSCLKVSCNAGVQDESGGCDGYPDI